MQLVSTSFLGLFPGLAVGKGPGNEVAIGFSGLQMNLSNCVLN